MDFRDAVKFVLEIEGGDRLVDHPQDPGGLTKYGISLKAYPSLGRQGIADLTESQATAIYRRDYWDLLDMDSLPVRLRLPLFDGAVNHGQVASVKILQRTLRIMGENVHVDGKLGPKTLSKIRGRSEKAVLVEFLGRRQLHYRSLKNYKVFGSGWEKRIIEVAINS